ncbi:hypothetical protein Clacol_005214 [Clathrus columnatus]|uniref:Uncharacterized protein n=1 Tax=Clathrus columnatus TaxID=1419009 RepID=A0AAV5ADJ2_9AGAM|nr:hypothetical protein Clacol_005214 [Clathrus columnatus]
MGFGIDRYLPRGGEGQNPNLTWNLRHVNEEKTIFTLQASDPPSYIFASEGTGVVGTPLQSSNLQARDTGTPDVY